MKVIVSLFLICFYFSGFSQSNFEKGLNSATQRDFNSAITHFENELKKDSFNTSAYFNLGNCYFELKKYGKAILEFERVLKLKPGDDEALQSIELSYSKLNTNLQWKSSLTGLKRFIVLIGPNTWSILAVISAILIGLSVYSLLKQKDLIKKRFHKSLIGFELIILITCLYSANLALNYFYESKFGIVTLKEISTFSDEKKSKHLVNLKEGEKLEIIKSTHLLKVKRFDGSEFWIEPSDLEKI